MGNGQGLGCLCENHGSKVVMLLYFVR